MSEHDIETIEGIAALPDGQWFQDADGDYGCLMDTHMGFPQRMVMPKGGKMLVSTDHIKFPIHLADMTDSCEHKWGLIGEGHCRRCGTLIDFKPMYFEPEDMQVFREVAALNSRNDKRRAGSATSDSSSTDPVKEA